MQRNFTAECEQRTRYRLLSKWVEQAFRRKTGPTAVSARYGSSVRRRGESFLLYNSGEI